MKIAYLGFVSHLGMMCGGSHVALTGGFPVDVQGQIYCRVKRMQVCLYTCLSEHMVHYRFWAAC